MASRRHLLLGLMLATVVTIQHHQRAERHPHHPFAQITIIHHHPPSSSPSPRIAPPQHAHHHHLDAHHHGGSAPDSLSHATPLKPSPPSPPPPPPSRPEHSSTRRARHLRRTCRHCSPSISEPSSPLSHRSTPQHAMIRKPTSSLGIISAALPAPTACRAHHQHRTDRALTLLIASLPRFTSISAFRVTSAPTIAPDSSATANLAPHHHTTSTPRPTHVAGALLSRPLETDTSRRGSAVSHTAAPPASRWTSCVRIIRFRPYRHHRPGSSHRLAHTAAYSQRRQSN